MRGVLMEQEGDSGGTALSPEKPVESQMPLYPWPHCAFASESLSSISLIRGRGGRGRNHGARRWVRGGRCYLDGR